MRLALGSPSLFSIDSKSCMNMTTRTSANMAILILESTTPKHKLGFLHWHTKCSSNDEEIDNKQLFSFEERTPNICHIYLDSLMYSQATSPAVTSLPARTRSTAYRVASYFRVRAIAATDVVSSKVWS